MNKEEAIEILEQTKFNYVLSDNLREAIETVLAELEKKDDTCLHCGKGKPKYCEACYQDLISENGKLQAKKDNVEIYRGMDKIAEEICKEE